MIGGSISRPTRSYVIAGRVARGVAPDALWWDTADSYQFVRVEPHGDHDVVIFGGEDHKTGQQEDTEACYRRLEDDLRAIVPDVELTHRWSGQVIEMPDGLPYIGQSADRQYSATGYAGNGDRDESVMQVACFRPVAI